MRSYSFITRWHIDAPVATVWDAVVDVESWPQWWKYVRAVESVQKGDESGIGTVHRYTWTGRIPYGLTFDSRLTAITTHERLQAEAFGDLTGTGIWTFAEEGGTTRVRYDWNVSTSKKWMNLLAPLLEPMFRWNHDQIMSEGGRALAKRLGVRLLASEEA